MNLPVTSAVGVRQSEDQVEAEIVSFLQKRQWIVDRNHVGLFQTQYGTPIRIGRVGQCDWRAVRFHGQIEYLEIEVKATGKKPPKEQLEYIAIRSHQGIPATWANSLPSFQLWYEGKFRD